MNVAFTCIRATRLISHTTRYFGFSSFSVSRGLKRNARPDIQHAEAADEQKRVHAPAVKVV
jgi:hypothetical protein